MNINDVLVKQQHKSDLYTHTHTHTHTHHVQDAVSDKIFQEVRESESASDGECVCVCVCVCVTCQPFFER